MKTTQISWKQICLAGLLGAEGIGILYFAQKAGGNILALLWCWVCGIVLVFLPGKAISTTFAANKENTTQKAITMVGGVLSLALAAVAASMLHFAPLVWLPALIGGVVLWKKRQLKPSSKPFNRLPLLTFWGAVALLYGIYALTFSHPTTVEAITPNQDFFWNLGNIQSFLNGFPPQDLRFSGVTVQYHYLTELLYAALTMASGLPAYDITAFYAVPLMLAMAIYALYQLAQTLFPTKLQKALCVSGLFLFGCAGMYKVLDAGISPFWNNQIQHIITNINAQTTTVLLLALFVILYIQTAHNGFSPKQSEFWFAIIAFVLLCFAKGPVAGIVAMAAACTAVVLLVFQLLPAKKPAINTVHLLLFAGGLLAVFGLLYFTFFSGGASQSMQMNPWGTLEKSWFANFIHLAKVKVPQLWWLFLAVFMVLQCLCFCPPAFAGALVGVPKDIKQIVQGTIPAERLLFCAGTAGGFLAFFLFDHYAMSQVYFGFVGMFFMGLLAIQNLPQIHNKILQTGLILLAVVSVATAGCTDVFLLKSGLRYLPEGAWNHQAQQQAENRLPLLAEEEQAMEFLHNAMSPNELFATNRNHTGSALEGLSNVYSALSGRGAYMESFKYTVSNMGVSMQEVQARIDWNTALFHPDTTLQQALQMCHEKGVRYVVYRQDAPGSEEPFLQMKPVFAGEKIRIYDAEQSSALE